jgi:hypothetical protein
MSAPAIVIRLELERRPVVYLDTEGDDEAARLNDWLAVTGQRELVDRAIELRAAA